MLYMVGKEDRKIDGADDYLFTCTMEMLDAFNLGGSEYARRITKDIDFIDTYDAISGKYAHKDADRVVDALAWALKQCQEKSGVV